MLCNVLKEKMLQDDDADRIRCHPWITGRTVIITVDHVTPIRCGTPDASEPIVAASNNRQHPQTASYSRSHRTDWRLSCRGGTHHKGVSIDLLLHFVSGDSE